MNETNLEIANLQEALNNKGFETIASDLSVIANDPNVSVNESEILNEVPSVEDAFPTLYLTESVEGTEPHIDGTYEKEVLEDLRKLAEYEEKVSKHKEKIKAFIEENNLGTFDGTLLTFKYTAATTTTSIDTTRLKKERPDLAAEYSKVSPRSSSISIKELSE